MKYSKKLSQDLTNNIYNLIVELIIKELFKDKSPSSLYNKRVVRITPVSLQY